MNSNINRFALFTASATYFLIVAGALVTSTGSGLAVPDWPLSFGQYFPPMIGGVFFEHGHRMIAGTVGILTTILMIWLWTKESRRWICWIGTAAWLSVIIQALLGGITVMHKLPTFVSASHAVLAQIFFCMVIAIAFFTRKDASVTDSADGGDTLTRTRIFSIAAMTAVYTQLALGAVIRHGGSISVLVLHAINAVSVLVTVGLLWMSVRAEMKQRKNLVWTANALLTAVSLQAILGVLSVFPPVLFGVTALNRAEVVTMHVGLGALILAATWILTLNCWENRLADFFSARQGNYNSEMIGEQR